MKYFYLGLLFLTANISLTAQEDRNFGDITPQDFTVPASMKDTSAGAVVLFEKGHTYFKCEKNVGFRMYFTCHKRVLILKQHGFDEANIEAVTYKGEKAVEEFSLLNAQSYNIRNGEVTPEKVSSKQVFVQDISERGRIHKFTFPAVKEGSIIEYKYEIKSPFMFEARSWFFQDRIPVLWSEYVVEYPTCFSYTGKFYGQDTLYKYDQVEGLDTIYVQFDMKSTWQEREQTYTDKIYVYNKVTHRMLMKDQQPFIVEPYVSAISNYINRAEFELEETDFPWDIHRDYSETWDKLNNNLLNYPWFGKELENTRLVKKQVNELTAGLKNDDEKAAVLLSYLQKELTWNGTSRIDVTTALDHVMERKKGNTADINMMLVLMMRSAGLDAWPVVLSTRSNGYMHDADPSLSKLNYVIAAYRTDSVWHLADATDKYTVVDLLPERCLNVKGWLVNPAGGRWISLIPVESSKEKNVLNLALSTDGKLKGDFTRIRDAQLALSLRNRMAALANQEAYVEKNIINSFNVNVTNFTFKELDNAAQPTEETYELNIPARANVSSGYIPFNPFVIKHFSVNPFRAATRVFPVEIPYRVEERYQVNITLPGGYKLKDIPQNVEYSMPGQGVQYVCIYTVQDNMLKIRSRLVMNSLLIPREEYSILRDVFEKIEQQQMELLSIVKQ